MKERYHGKRTEGGEKPKRPPLTKKQKWLIAAAAVLAVALVIVIAWQLTFVKPALPTKNPDDGSASSSAQGIDYGDGVRPRADGERKSKDFYTVLILGRDTGGGGNTDTMLLASYDVTNQKATVMSIPRDTMVNVSWDVKKINSVYNMNGGGEKGMEQLMEQVKNVVGFMPDGYALVNLSAFVEAVDLLGGLDFDVPMDMDYDDPDQNLFIHLKAGEQHLTGEQLMWVVRFRSGYANADIGRTEVQRAVMKTAMKQWLRPKTLAALPGLWRIYQENLTTDLSVRNIVWMARVLLKGMSGDIEANVLPGYATMAGDASVYMIDTYAASLGEGLQVLEAARMIEEGKSLDEIKTHLLARRPHVCQFFTVDDLAYLKRGGRISSATALIGTVLSIKPILRGDETGHIVSCGKVRGMKRAYQELANYFDTRVLDKSESIGIAHADNAEGAEALLVLLREKGFTGECLTVCYEPVTGAHVGPGTVALFFYGKEK